MRLSHGMLAALAIMFVPVTAQAGDWYSIQNIDGKCTNKDSNQPAEMIENAHIIGQRYVSRDILQPSTGRIIETTLEFPDVGMQIKYYRGTERCEAALEKQRSQTNSDTARYR
jgi:hypothetical protein